ncbi:TetR/AcrR family transcriptional regulator [Mycolicibacterium sp. P9-22]|uniref:TetR/AcrR family transcriptional regulator n=1 Tax=Mycolicibacterium sp. P9-22 TaxID=2024613 RepID=UPI0011EEFE4D|nr:TetR/AcrR family transcriptional regulator [Mycolicibacterium sp. P9-22]KAA0115236.1 TetR/AcrR family transcriptional regulator [Mycolicibacterium sp. P9-22]
MQDAGTTELRADARENRARILDTARSVFAERGLSASLEDIARRAGVGVGTLYRRFPCREELIGAVFATKMNEYADAAECALAQEDPWQGFCTYIETVCRLQAADQGFADLMTLNVPGAKELQEPRDRAHADFVELIHRAKTSGHLREDFVAEDLMLLLMANAGVVAATNDAAPGSGSRFVAYMLQAFASEAAKPLPPAPSPRRMYRAMMRVSSRGGSRRRVP